MIKFRYSRHRALGDFKRTWRDGKTTCGATSAKCQGILAPLARGGMSKLIDDSGLGKASAKSKTIVNTPPKGHWVGYFMLKSVCHNY
jgi:hypothetical protein